ncbi:MFS transporter [Aquicella lusitana]|uniref:Putative MFS family arabinose efflux permease n=1 Tax=Aquicella lusitana TaxID=254246 RepID=A0A370GD18_9COXI|nr:MFS transporter [Aquicella lusitana]RDI40959.1 putative MFS family arabinose efflux permease [Aquicella lusitana]VVC73636.1 Enterobactin exporter EntS [Aquicella lusitana]
MSYFINLSIFRRNRNFTLLYIGQFVSFLGTMITGVALPYQIYMETRSTLMVGLLSLAQLLPLLVTALIGGVFADRYHRRLLLLVAEAVLAVGCLLLALNSWVAVPHIWVIFVVSSLMSAFNGLHRPALDSIVQQIVEKKDLPIVSSLGTFKFSVAMIAGPAIGGLIIAHAGIFETYLVDFATFLVSLIAILCMTHIPKPTAAMNESTLLALKKGLKYALSRQELVGTYVIDFVAMVFGMPTALFPAIALSFGGPKVLGMMYSAPAVGALVVSFFSGWIAGVKRHGVAIAVAAAFWGVAIIFFGLASNFWLALFFLVLAGAFDGISGIFRMTMWNETIPNELRGRMAGIEMISYLSGPKLGDTEAGLVAAAFGITVSVVSGGVLCVAAVLASCYFLPKFWRYQSDLS